MLHYPVFMGILGIMKMKTTVEIPTALYRRSRSIAAVRGISFRQFLAEALEEKTAQSDTRGWMDSFGALAAEPEAVYEVDRIVEREFATVDARDWE